jgi:hypothetical protein
MPIVWASRFSPPGRFQYLIRSDLRSFQRRWGALVLRGDHNRSEVTVATLLGQSTDYRARKYIVRTLNRGPSGECTRARKLAQLAHLEGGFCRFARGGASRIKGLAGA